ncbi:Type I MADS box transcription factor [Rhynchospora pubera]|uniref:Type I MADS box transcription factor n=1 Tax=Rhynchospora pubera TaxID=906938 RepID=A0AAV8FMK9_9POAL|nr:Type I MADS box transcription factor [Rhynchospora pubera]
MTKTKVKMNVHRISFPCGINVYVITYSSEDDATQTMSQTLDAGRVTADSNNLPELNHAHNMNDQVAIMEARHASLTEILVQLQNVNSLLERRRLLYEGLGGRDLSNLPIKQLRAVDDTVDELLSRIHERIRVLSLQEQGQNEGVAETAVSSTQELLGNCECPMEGQDGFVSSSDSTEGGDGEEDHDYNAE